jgi:hypothetical protein
MQAARPGLRLTPSSRPACPTLTRRLSTLIAKPLAGGVEQTPLIVLGPLIEPTRKRRQQRHEVVHQFLQQRLVPPIVQHLDVNPTHRRVPLDPGDPETRQPIPPHHPHHSEPARRRVIK